MARLVASQFQQWADLPIVATVPNGWDNRTFRLGPDLLVRLPSAEAVAQVRRASLAAGACAAPATADPQPWRWEGRLRAIRGTGRSTAGSKGCPPSTVRIAPDLTEFAVALASSWCACSALNRQADRRPARTAFFRGGPLETYSAETRNAIAAVQELINAELAV